MDSLCIWPKQHKWHQEHGVSSKEIFRHKSRILFKIKFLMVDMGEGECKYLQICRLDQSSRPEDPGWGGASHNLPFFLLNFQEDCY